jgi:hypothetical protein
LVALVLGVVAWQSLRWESLGPELRLISIEGAVTITAGDATRPARAGDPLLPADQLLTGSDGRASMRLGDDTTISVGPTSSLEITAVDATGVSLELEDGALSATVRPDSGAVRVGSRGRSVVSTNAVFDVGVEGELLQVAVSEGEVAMSGTDVTRVGAGQQVWVVDRHGTVDQIPEELLLAVQWPTEAKTRREQWVVEGRTVPGATIRVRGGAQVVEVKADATGVFRANVLLAEGENRVVVESTDLLGRRTEVPGVLVRDSSGPRFQAGVEYGRP